MKQKFLGLIVFLIYRVYSWTYRFEVHYEDESDRKLVEQALNTKKAHNENVIIGFFHQQELSTITYFANRGIHVLVSKSKDGEIMATAAKLLGYVLIRGSSHRRAIASFIECLKKVREGFTLCMAVDGPRGPIFKVKDGIPKLSEKTKRPILPVVGQPVRYWKLEKSWNKMLVPKPFTKIHLYYGKVKPYTAIELEEKLNSLRTI